MREGDGIDGPATMIEFYDPKALTRCHFIKLEEILREVEEFLKLHRGSGNMNLGNIDEKSTKISILTLTEELSAADPKVAKFPYLNVILTNGVKLKYYVAPPRYSATRILSNDDLILVSVDASPVESALDSY